MVVSHPRHNSGVLDTNNGIAPAAFTRATTPPSVFALLPAFSKQPTEFDNPEDKHEIVIYFQTILYKGSMGRQKWNLQKVFIIHTLGIIWVTNVKSLDQFWTYFEFDNPDGHFTKSLDIILCIYKLDMLLGITRNKYLTSYSFGYR